MNENVILVVDYGKICRLCLHSTGAMSDLFEVTGENSLKELVLRATGLEVEIQDGFPSKICHRCRYIVELNCELRDMAAKTNMLLMNAGHHVEAEEQIENILESQIPELQNCKQKDVKKRKKTDLRLIMQEDGIMSLVKQDPGTPVDEIPGPIEWDKDTKMKTNEIKEETVASRRKKSQPKHLTCQMCLTTFSKEEDVSDHVNTHYVDTKLTPYLELQKPYRCEVCNRIVSKTQLIKHHRSHLNINPFVCKHEGCNYIGKSQESIRQHVVSHGARAQVCEVCGAAFRRRYELRQHAARCHAAAPAHCRLCRKRFRNAVSLRAHCTLYHRPRKYVCEWEGCSKAYHTPASLVVHKRTHTDERIYRCHLCSVAAYTSQSKLNRHLRMHSRARLSKCDKCPATFEDYGAFYKHRISEHGQWMAHKCLGCDKRFHTEAKLSLHVQVCEKVATNNGFQDDVQSDEKTQQLLVSSIQEIIDNENARLQNEASGNLLNKFKGQSLLVQPGDIGALSKELELQDLPPDGLLYIEVDDDADEENQTILAPEAY